MNLCIWKVFTIQESRWFRLITFISHQHVMSFHNRIGTNCRDRQISEVFKYMFRLEPSGTFFFRVILHLGTFAIRLELTPAPESIDEFNLDGFVYKRNRFHETIVRVVLLVVWRRAVKPKGQYLFVKPGYHGLSSCIGLLCLFFSSARIDNCDTYAYIKSFWGQIRWFIGIII